MTEQTKPPTATIYQFPAQGRSTSARHPSVSERKAKPVLHQQTAGFTAVACGEAWYHDAAMEQSIPGFGYDNQQH